ncbi:Gfo/Idh/MocA family protein [Halorussus sp. MSC15.2]|uniref:Gfo/Idh/MocA family protein n=1 Tax=Halorussus sp. MSC15.2 TaxID=2283638 RepID=UPI0013D77625|nr:Gfo/Idh/MocA family oxidoreductase [Halorussus sp. MSC15.2]NEU56568.1 Gfo/Idh/MocA family oxidoreductase [Halorussus sp. MSC15.2]
MFAAETLDWVHVATPVQSHFDLASAAVERGIPVTVQKPATTTREELDDLRDLAAEREVPVSVVHNWLFYPVVRDLRRRIAAGEFGEIRAVEATFSGEGRPDDTYRGEWVYDLPGGDVEEGMPHPLYLTLALGGVPRDAESVDVQTRASATTTGSTTTGPPSSGPPTTTRSARSRSSAGPRRTTNSASSEPSGLRRWTSRPTPSTPTTPTRDRSTS